MSSVETFEREEEGCSSTFCCTECCGDSLEIFPTGEFDLNECNKGCLIGICSSNSKAKAQGCSSSISFREKASFTVGTSSFLCSEAGKIVSESQNKTSEAPMLNNVFVLVLASFVLLVLLVFGLCGGKRKFNETQISPLPISTDIEANEAVTMEQPKVEKPDLESQEIQKEKAQTVKKDKKVEFVTPEKKNNIRETESVEEEVESTNSNEKLVQLTKKKKNKTKNSINSGETTKRKKTFNSKAGFRINSELSHNSSISLLNKSHIGHSRKRSVGAQKRAAFSVPELSRMLVGANSTSNISLKPQKYEGVDDSIHDLRTSSKQDDEEASSKGNRTKHDDEKSTKGKRSINGDEKNTKEKRKSSVRVASQFSEVEQIEIETDVFLENNAEINQKEEQFDLDDLNI